MNINKKIIQYLDYKGISQRSFSKKMVLSEGILRRGNNLGSVNFKKMRSLFPDLNINWVLFGEGNMILDEPNILKEPMATYKIETKNELLLLQKEQIRLQKELLEAKDIIIALTNSINELKNK